MGRVNHVCGHHQIFVQKIGRLRAIGFDAADTGRRQHDTVGTVLSDEVPGGGLIRQVEFVMGCREWRR
jgi:hypothetical protein